MEESKAIQTLIKIISHLEHNPLISKTDGLIKSIPCTSDIILDDIDSEPSKNDVIRYGTDAKVIYQFLTGGSYPNSFYNTLQMNLMDDSLKVERVIPYLVHAPSLFEKFNHEDRNASLVSLHAHFLGEKRDILNVDMTVLDGYRKGGKLHLTGVSNTGHYVGFSLSVKKTTFTQYKHGDKVSFVGKVYKHLFPSKDRFVDMCQTMFSHVTIKSIDSEE